MNRFSKPGTSPDDCDFCDGRRGGAKGNENVVRMGPQKDKKVKHPRYKFLLCDFCHAEGRDAARGWPRRPYDFPKRVSDARDGTIAAFLSGQIQVPGKAAA